MSKLDVSAYIQQLSKAGIESPTFEVRLLLSHVMGKTREEMLLMDDIRLSEAEQQQFEALIARRVAREPMSHLLGTREFYGREFFVSKDVLDPRADTETLVEVVLESGIWNLESRIWHQESGEKPPNDTIQIPNSRFQILDIGTGSGCIIITLLKEIAGASGVGLDISADALRVAFANKMHHDLENQLDLVHGNMDDIFKKNSVLSEYRFDLIVSNPPYIPSLDIEVLMPEVRDYEPHIALDGGKDGLDTYRKLAKSTAKLLKPDGLLVLEIGAGQTDDVTELFLAAHWQRLHVQKDLAGHDRCMVFKPH